MTAPVQPQGTDPEQVRQDIAKIKAAGREDLLKRYFERNGLNPADFQDSNAEKPGVGHALGVIGRSLVGGVESAFRAPFNAAGAAFGAMANHFVGPEAGAMVQQVAHAGPNRVADLLNLPNAVTPLEKTAAPILEDAAGAIPFALGEGPLALASTAASGVVGGMAARSFDDPKSKVIAGLVAGLATPALMSGGAEAIRLALAGSQAQRTAALSSQAILAAATGQDLATLGQVAEGGIARGAEKLMRGKVSPVAQRFGKAVAAQDAGMQGSARKMLDDLAPADMATPETMGDAMRLGIEGPKPVGALEGQVDEILKSGVKGPATPVVKSIKANEGYLPRFREESGKLYAKADGFVPPDTPVIPTNLINLFKQYQNVGAYDPKRILPDLGDPVIERRAQQFLDFMAQQKNANGAPFAMLKNLRTSLDDEIDNFDPLVAASQPKRLQSLRGLRSALSNDLGASIIQNGGKEGATAWQAANKYYQANMDQIEDIFKPLINKRTPEEIFSALMSGSKRGATAVRTSLNELGPEQRRIVLSSMMRRIMQGADGESIDLNAAAKTWAKMTPELRATLTEHLGVEHTNTLNNLFKATKVLQTANLPVPGTSTGGLYRTILTGLQGIGGASYLTGIGNGLLVPAAGATAVGATGLSILSRAFTSPRMVRWLLGTTKLPTGVLGAQLVQLGKQAQKWPPADRSAAMSLIDHFQSGVDAPSPVSSDMTAVAR